MAQCCGEQGVEMWSYCLMTNHIHLIAVPSTEDGLRWAIDSAHERYTRRIKFREKRRGYLWQGRFASLRDEPCLLAAARYAELNHLRRHRRTGRPLGNETFVERREAMVGRVWKPQKRGPKLKGKTN